MLDAFLSRWLPWRLRAEVAHYHAAHRRVGMVLRRIWDGAADGDVRLPYSLRADVAKALLGVPEAVAALSPEVEEDDGWATLRHPASVAMADAFVQELESGRALNYIEVHFFHPKHGEIAVLVQRVTGETPAQKASRLRREILALQASAAHLENA